MFIVIEGLDGAGKSTQVRMIQAELLKRGVESEYLHFPRYDAPIYGELIAKFLRGDLGSLDSVDPYIVALLYAGDRKDANSLISGWLSGGKTVIVDRYVYSNIAYQCAKICCEVKREALADWIFDLEYSHNGIERPDITLFLDVPFTFTVKNLTEEREGQERDYLNGKKDIHEASLDLQQRVRDIYLEQAKKDQSFKIIDCSNSDGKMAPAEVIFDRIQQVLAL